MRREANVDLPRKRSFPRGGSVLEVAIELASRRDALVQQLVLGVSAGALVGTGVRVTTLSEDGLAFERSPRWVGDGPDHGEIRVHPGGAERTTLKIRLACGSMRRLCAVKAILGGVVLATACALAFGWLIPWSVAVGILGAIGADIAGWRRARARLVGRVECFVANIGFLGWVPPDLSTGSVHSAGPPSKPGGIR